MGMKKTFRSTPIEKYAEYVDKKTINRIKKKAEKFQDLHITHINSTYYGGGVAELLSPLTLLMNDIGIKTGWRVIQGTPDFFSVTKKIHNALQGGEIDLTEQKKFIYEKINFENSVRNHLEHDIVIVHDPQVLPMINHYKKYGPWVWRCHLDLSSPDKKLWKYLKQFIEKYDAVIYTLAEYKKNLTTPELTFFPAIDPFCSKNWELPEELIQKRLEHYNIPTDLPLIVQISRFDRWKDPEGVIKAFNLARKEVDCRLVLLGNVATDDPEGEGLYKCLLNYANDRILIISQQDSILVNALQRKADVVVQKSLKEAFGLTVTESMWKRAAIIGGNTGGIRHQIHDGYNGFLVSSVEETAKRIVELLNNKALRKTLGERARQTVIDQFLMTKLLERYLDLFGSFETIYRLERFKYE